MNLVILSGRLTKDPEVRYTQSGKAVASLTLAVDRGYGDKKQTSFINCTMWEKTAETAGNTLTKGRKILVEGEWVQRSYETKDGQKRRVDECLVHRFEYGDNKKADQTPDNHNPNAFDDLGKDTMSDEDIPF